MISRTSISVHEPSVSGTRMWNTLPPSDVIASQKLLLDVTSRLAAFTDCFYCPLVTQPQMRPRNWRL